LFDSEVKLKLTAPAGTIAAGGTASLGLVGTFANRLLAQGFGGSLTYEVEADGATVEPTPAPVRLDAKSSADARTYRVTPTAPVAILRLRLRNTPCVWTWTWRSLAPAAVAAGQPPPPALTAPAADAPPPSRGSAVAAAAPAGPAGTSLAEANAEVNRQIVAARKAYDLAQTLGGDDRRAALQEALDRLTQIVDRYPGADHAVTLVGGGEVAGISIPSLKGAIAAGRGAGDGTPSAAGTGPLAAAASGPRRLTVTAVLLGQALVTGEGSYRFGVRHSLDIRPFLSVFAMAEPKGSLVLDVARGSPAEAAGILPGDMIVRLAGRDVDHPRDLSGMIERTPSAIAVEVEAIRIGEGPEGLVSALRARAAGGSREALTALAELAYTSFRGKQDVAEAVRLYRTTAELGDALAALRIGSMSVGGIGGAVDLAAGTRWLRQAADAGLAEAAHQLGILHWTDRYWDGHAAVGDDAEAVRLFRSAADRDVAASFFYVGVAYHVGRGVAVSYPEARRWYEKGVAAGDASAMTNLAFMHFAGTGSAINYVEARRLGESAAALGDAAAKRLLGQIYRDGKGVPADRAKAVAYFREAATADDTPAMYELAVMLDAGNEAAAKAEAVEWFTRASSKGDYNADYALAVIYLGGRGTAADHLRSADLLVQAIERGNTFAATEMKTNSRAWPMAVLAALQQRLRDKGLYGATIDGRIGPNTIRAIDALAATAKGRI
jgi:TPR repeat protein